MSESHPWLETTPWPTAQLPREELSVRIDHFLATQWMGVLCTIGKNGPIGSPVEYYADGLNIFILPQPNSPKVKAMQRDPRLCFAIHGENSGWASVRGAQVLAMLGLLTLARQNTNTACVFIVGSNRLYSSANLWIWRRRCRCWSLSPSGLFTPSTGCVKTVLVHGRYGIAIPISKAHPELIATNQKRVCQRPLRQS